LIQAIWETAQSSSLPRKVLLSGLGLSIGFHAMSHSNAQQPPTWSPQPFASEQATSRGTNDSSIPRNSLRATESKNDSNVLRWKDVGAKSKLTSQNRSFGPSLETDSQSSKESKLHSQEQAKSEATTTRDNVVYQPPRSTSIQPRTLKNEPASGFDPKGSDITDSNVQLASYGSVVQAGSSESKTRSKATSNGVWYDRSASQASESEPQIVVGSPIELHSQLNGIERARFQQPGLDRGNLLPETLGLSPAQLPDFAPNDSTSPTLEEILKSEPPKIQPQQRSGRSLIEPEQNSQKETPPSPFPKPKSQQGRDGSSPSDSSNPPPTMKPRKDMDKAPMPPMRNVASSNCDSIRQLVQQADITKIVIDSSSPYVEGYKSKDASNNTKEAFVASAPIRPWYDFEGNEVTRGKLADLALGKVVIERSDGTRFSILATKLSEADQVYVSEKWGIPVTCTIADRAFPNRDFMDTTVTWKASGACHKPLYFEEVQLERYGHEWGPFAQPVISSAHFFGNVAVLPYKMGIHPMNECQYSVGHYRPGSCAPWTVGPIPISLRGALTQAGAVTGAVLALP